MRVLSYSKLPTIKDIYGRTDSGRTDAWAKSHTGTVVGSPTWLDDVIKPYKEWEPMEAQLAKYREKKNRERNAYSSFFARLLCRRNVDSYEDEETHKDLNTVNRI